METNTNIIKKSLSSISSFKPSKLEIILFAALVLTVIFLWLFPSGNKDAENKRLTTEIKQLQKQKDSIVNNITLLEKQYKNSVLSDSVKYNNLLQINQQLAKIDQSLSISITNLNSQKSLLDSINNKIKINETLPDTKVGDDLLKSLKSKLNI